MRIVMLPGLGADMRLFVPQLKHFEDSVVPAWSDFYAERKEPLRSYAERYLVDLLESGAAPRSGERAEPWALVGFSFGGQVALELAHLIATGRTEASRNTAPLRSVTLIASHRTDETIDAAFKRNVRWGTRLPGPIIRLGRRAVAGRFAKLNSLDAFQQRMLREMASDADIAALRTAARSAAAWAFGSSEIDEIEAAGILVRQAHGSRDTVIPPPIRTPDMTLDGPHLLTWTHAEEINRFIEGSIEAR